MDRRDTRLGKYQLLERLGEGGMGTVYRARDEMLDRDVAIKVLRPDLVRQQALVERFRTEAIALARLAHPRIATLYGLERDGDELYMVMEFLRGETLEALVQRQGRLSWRRAAEICAQIAEALDHAHDHGVVHRDIKPANVMIGPGGAVKVMDFGIARMAGSSRQTRHGHSVGTPAYMAPEQLRGEECDGRTDLYALGAVFYELVTGRVAFEADSDYKLMMQQLNDPPPPPSASNPELPAIVDATVLRAMAKRPGDRYASAAAMRNALMDAAAAVVTEAVPLAARSDETPPTRLAGPAAPSLTPPETRIAAGSPPEPPPTAEHEATAARTPIWLDWRAWSAVAMLALAAGLVLRPDPAPEPPAPPPAPSSVPAPTSERPTVLPGAATAPAPASEGIVVVPPPAAPAPVPPAAPPRRRTAAPATPPPAAPERSAPREERAVDPAPTPEPKAVDEAAELRAARAAVASWLAGLARKEGPAPGGTVDGQDAAGLVREGRLAVASHGTPSVNLDGARATATGSAELEVRSAFGATRKRSGRFRVELSRTTAGGWSVTRGSVEG
ncbi:MAG TPA: serine/threonine-protein kinase [Gemmatimonadales bacterium]|nr:serine/threonine-protein kinase [Gemmatimonadales bacterium]HRX17853.1 serine/threonine-protein kinase [Gemmatimonadales bacterium]